MAKLIYLSPSNHGKNQNKCLKAGCYEDKHTRPIAEVCAKHLKNNGFEVIVAQPNQNMAARCNEADKRGADLYVPIHTNASATASARYLLFMFYSDSGKYRAIFDAVAPYLEDIYPGKIKAHFSRRANLYEINRPKAKTIYCELGFHTNPTDVENFIHEPEKVGKALAKGICKYYGVAFKDGTSDAEPAPKPDTKPDLKPISQPKPPTTIRAGSKIQLKSVPLYSTSTVKIPSTHISGTYYLWDNKVYRGRIRITNLQSRVGVEGQVTGWIDKSHIV